jgi:hypothetical protein
VIYLDTSCLLKFLREESESADDLSFLMPVNIGNGVEDASKFLLLKDVYAGKKALELRLHNARL